MFDGFQDKVRSIFNTILDGLGTGENEKTAFGDLFKLDIFRMIMLNAPQREKIFLDGQPFASHTDRRQPGGTEEPAVISSAYGKIVSLAYDTGSLENLHLLKESIRPNPSRVYLFSAFDRWNTGMLPVTPLLETIIRSVYSNRPIPVSNLITIIERQLRSTVARSDILSALESYKAAGIIRFV